MEHSLTEILKAILAMRVPIIAIASRGHFSVNQQ